MSDIIHAACPYCGAPVEAAKDWKRVNVTCESCGHVIVFDYGGAGIYGLWYALPCLRCRHRRVDDAVTWHCAAGGCDELKPKRAQA